MSDAYFGQFDFAVAEGARRTGKTRNLSIVHELNHHFLPSLETAHVGGTWPQALRCYSYVQEYLRKRPLGAAVEPQLLQREQRRLQSSLAAAVEGESLVRETRWRNGSRLYVMPGTESQVSGPHPQRAVGDEVDHWGWNVYQLFLGMPMTSELYPAQTILTSARRRPYGTMSRIISEAREKGAPLYRWCVFEAMRRCPDCEDASLAARGIKSEPPKCPLWPDCQGKVRRATGHVRKQDVIMSFQGSDSDTWCLHQDARVLMADGSRKRVADIVKSRDSGPVQSLEGGRLVAKKVVGWHATPLGRRQWARLRYERARCMGPDGQRKRTLWLTEEHPVLTPDGWRPAGALRDGDLVLTDEAAPSPGQEQAICGTLLGDASLWVDAREPRSRACLDLLHCERQRPWLDLKRQALADLGAKEIAARRPRFVTGASAYWQKLYERWYSNGRKVVDRRMVGRCFSARMLATWYLDDGSLGQRGQAEFATHCFSRSDVDWLIRLFGRHGFQARAQAQPNKKNMWRIYLSVESSEKLLQQIAPFVPDSLRYKLRETSRRAKRHFNRPGRPVSEPRPLPPFDPRLWQLEPALRFVDRVEVSRGCPPHQKTAYCLDVEDTQLFFASGIAVHNCVQYLLKKSSSKGLVYSNWSTDLNVSEEAEYNPEWDVLWCCDWGYESPLCISLAQITPGGDVHIFDMIYVQYLMTRDALEYVHQIERVGMRDEERWYVRDRETDEVRGPYRRPVAAYVDPSAKEMQGEIERLQIPVVAPVYGVIDGCSIVRRLICSSGGRRSLLVHPRCKPWIREAELYHKEEVTPGVYGEQPEKDTHGNNPSHALDGVRYMCSVTHRERGAPAVF